MFRPFDSHEPPPPGQPSSSTGAINEYRSKHGIASGPPSQLTQPSMLFMGYGKQVVTPFTNATVAERPERGATEKGITVDDAQSRFANSGTNNIRHWALLLALAGYAGSASPEQAVEFARMAPLAVVLEKHLDFLQDSANVASPKKITPNQWLKIQLSYSLGDKWDGKLKSLTPENVMKTLGPEAGPKSRTQTSRSVDISSASEARGLVRGLLQQELGRDPTQAEYEDFVAALHSAERKNPTITTSTQHYGADGQATSSSTTSRGGVDGGQVLYEKLKKQPSWGEWQAMGIYAPALFEALGAAVGGV